MPINNALLISAPVLQNFLVDANGDPLSNGTITFFQDAARTKLKNVYFQSSNTGGYQYMTLPNPLSVSAAGLICDATGSPTNPFYYPYSETDNKTPQSYYITIVDQNNLVVNTLQNFPFVVSANAPSGNLNPNNQNLITNNAFWRNIGSQNLTNVTNAVVAPSLHDGFVYNGTSTATYPSVGVVTMPTGPDIMFTKTNTSATDALVFNTFLASTNPILNGDINPEYYLTHTCSLAGTAETYKVYQFPIALHVANLANASFTATIQAQSLGGAAGSNIIKMNLYQSAGTNGVGSNVQTMNNGTFNTGPTWQQYTCTWAFPSASGLTLSLAGDDAFYLQVAMPLNVACTINFTLPSLYLCPVADIPTNSFTNYDQVNAIISSPRTGDVRLALNKFGSPSNFGWCPMNNGLISWPQGTNATTYFARAAKDTWPLYDLLWTLFKPYDTGATSNPICQMYTVAASSVSLANYGADAYTDFTAGKALQLTKTMGQVLMGTVPLESLLPADDPTTNTGTGYSSVVTASSSTGLLLTPAGAPAHALGIFKGCPVIFTNTGGALPTGIAANTIYYAVPVTGGTTFKIALSFANAMTSTVVAYTNTGSGTTTVYFAAAGMAEGEYAHTQLAAELPPHTHTIWKTSGAGVATPGASQAFETPAALGVASGNGPGTSAPANVTQPGLFTNFFIKL